MPIQLVHLPTQGVSEDDCLSPTFGSFFYNQNLMSLIELGKVARRLAWIQSSELLTV